MKKTLASLTVAATAAGLLAGCAADGTSTMTNTQRNTAIGTAVGALAGAAIGHHQDGTDTLKGALIGAAVGGTGTYLWSNHMEKQKQQMQAATAGTPVQVTQTADNRLKINVPADAGFATSSATLNANMYPVLNTLATTLNQNPVTTVSIVGHTDSTGSDAINNPLSLERAASARSYLADRGVAPGRIEIAGRGAREPLADNGSEAGRATNRRIEIFVAEAAR